MSLWFEEKNTYDYARVLKQASILIRNTEMEKTLTLKCSTSNNISEYLTLQLILTYKKTQAKI